MVYFVLVPSLVCLQGAPRSVSPNANYPVGKLKLGTTNFGPFSFIVHVLVPMRTGGNW